MLIPVNILAVDDRPENLLALEASLRGDHLVILKAQSGDEALEKLLQHDVALAIVDVQMPGMDGFELAELMRGAERTRHIPIIFLTAGSIGKEGIFRGYESGAVDFLFKPYDPRVLKSKVNVFVELYRQRQELNEALRFSDLFVGILGHDLRNPLSAIVHGAHLFQRDADEKKAYIAGRVLNSAKRMTQMIEEILDFTRLRIGGGIPLNPSQHDISELTTTVVEELRLGIGAGRIDLETSGEGRAVCDGPRLMQALSNLLGNALQHGSAEHPVQVRVDGADTAEVRIEIRNRGTISPELLPVIFDPFRRASTRAAQNQKDLGLGLGLYIAQQIVDSHNGRIEITSNEETVAKLIIPRTASAQTKTP